MPKKKPTGPPPPSATVSAAIEAEIEDRYLDARKALKQGAPGKAVRLIKQPRARHGARIAAAAAAGSPDIHLLLLGTEAAVFSGAAVGFDMLETKRQYHRHAVEAARQLAEARPDAISFANIYSMVLHRMAVDEGLGFEEAARECQRGLEIEDAVIFVKSSSGSTFLPSPDSTLALVRQKLRERLELCRKGEPLEICREGTWWGISAEGNAEEEEQKEQELRRKKIEAQVLAARIAQQLPQQQPPPSLEERRDPKSDLDMSAYADWVSKAMAFWLGPMTSEQKDRFFQVPVEELRAHCSLLKTTPPALDYLSEALSLPGAQRGEWKAWACCECGEKFSSAKEHWQHLEARHLERCPKNLKYFLPANADDSLTANLLNGHGRPFDIPRVVEMLEGQQGASLLASAKNAIITDIVQMFPISDDSERADALQETHDTLQQLVALGCLFQFQLLKFAMDTVNALRQDLPSVHERMRCLPRDVRAPLSLRLLRATELRKNLKVLKILEQRFKVQRDRQEYNSSEVAVDGSGRSEGVERVVLSRDSTSLLLDDKIFREIFTDDAEDDGIGRVDLFQWLYTAGLSVEKNIAAWTNVRELNRETSIECIAMHKKILHTLETERERRHGVLSQLRMADKGKYEEFEAELWKIDTSMLHKIAEMRNLQCRLGQISVTDHCEVIIPLIQSFLLAHLNNLREKDAIKKSHSAGEASLANLKRVDSMKNNGNVDNQSKQEKGKAKNKRNSKNYRRTNGIVEASKETAEKSTEGDLFLQKTAEDPFLVSNAASYLESLPLSSHRGYWKQYIKEIEQNIVLECVKRSITQILECQEDAGCLIRQNGLEDTMPNMVNLLETHLDSFAAESDEEVQESCHKTSKAQAPSIQQLPLPQPSPSAVWVKKVMAFWMDSMTSEQKDEFFRVPVEELRAHCTLLKSTPSASGYISQALSLPGAQRGEWKVWVCCKCGEKLFSAEKHWLHLEDQHLENIPENLKPLLPANADADFMTKLLNGYGEPFDIPGVVQMLDEQKRKLGSLLEDPNDRREILSYIVQIFPISDDFKRAELLKEIRDTLQLLVDCTCFFQFHVQSFAGSSRKALQQGLPSVHEWMKDLPLDAYMPLCLRLLRAPDLQEILLLLNLYAKKFKLQGHTEEYISCEPDIDFSHGSGGLEKVVLSHDSSSFLLYGKISGENLSDDTEDDGRGVDFRTFFPYLYKADLSVEKKLAEWKNQGELKLEEGMECIEMHKKILHSLETDFEKKCEIESHEDGVAQRDQETRSKLNKVDASMIEKLAEMRNLQHRLGQISLIDHSEVIVPLIQSFLLVHLDNLREKYAIEKSHAAGEACLVDLIKDDAVGSNENGDSISNKQRERPTKKEAKTTEIVEAIIVSCFK